MRITKAATNQVSSPNLWARIIEPFTGAWQQNAPTVKRGDLLSYPTLYAVLSRISTDIGTLPFRVKRQASDAPIATLANSSPFLSVLNNPNSYQTPQQFREAWSLSKQTYGNTYVLLQRDARTMVNALYILDPTRVLPVVSTDGSVFYRINYGTDNNLLPEAYGKDQVTIPATEVIHDRMNCFHHQLIGVPPLCAANWAAVKNMRILRSAAQFFGNNAQPGGILTAPAGMSADDAAALKAYWKENYSGDNSGLVAVIGADMKFTSFAMKSTDAQLVEQMQYSDTQICQPFHVPKFIVGIGELPAGLKADDMLNVYYRFALQGHITSMETLLTRALRLPAADRVDLDLSVLLRMDPEKRATVFGGLADHGIATPNEARQEFNFPPLAGGDTVYMQQQDIPLDQARKNGQPPPAPPAPALPPAPPEPPARRAPDEPRAPGEETAKMLAELSALRGYHNAHTMLDLFRETVNHG